MLLVLVLLLLLLLMLLMMLARLHALIRIKGAFIGQRDVILKWKETSAGLRHLLLLIMLLLLLLLGIFGQWWRQRVGNDVMHHEAVTNQ